MTGCVDDRVYGCPPGHDVLELVLAMLGMGPPTHLTLQPAAFAETLKGCVEAERAAKGSVLSRHVPDLAPLATGLSRRVLDLQKGFFDQGGNKADSCLSLGKQDACMPLYRLVRDLSRGRVLQIHLTRNCGVVALHVFV
jgi:hypothetical protein